MIHAEDDGKSFDVNRGSPVTFKLASNSGTGFQWVPGRRVSEHPGAAGRSHPGAVCSRQAPGAPKLDVYHFLASAPGTAVVEMDLESAPSATSPPAASFT